MTTKKILPILIVAVLVMVGAAFYGGMLYGKSQRTNANFANLTADQRTARMQAGGFAGRGGANVNGGLASGEVLSKDDKSITIKLRDGGSKIVFLGSSTETMKTVVGTAADLTVGQQVVVTGTDNSDGSINAQNVQIRPAGSMPLGGAAGQGSGQPAVSNPPATK